MKQTQLNQLIKDLDTVLEHHWPDEQKHYEEAKGDGEDVSDHIFTVMERLEKHRKLLSKVKLAGTYKVVVEVEGGLAEVTECPSNVAVKIIDHDNEKVGN